MDDEKKTKLAKDLPRIFPYWKIHELLTWRWFIYKIAMDGAKNLPDTAMAKESYDAVGIGIFSIFSILFSRPVSRPQFIFIPAHLSAYVCG